MKPSASASVALACPADFHVASGPARLGAAARGALPMALLGCNFINRHAAQVGASAKVREGVGCTIGGVVARLQRLPARPRSAQHEVRARAVSQP